MSPRSSAAIPLEELTVMRPSGKMAQAIKKGSKAHVFSNSARFPLVDCRSVKMKETNEFRGMHRLERFFIGAWEEGSMHIWLRGFIYLRLICLLLCLGFIVFCFCDVFRLREHAKQI